MQKHNTPFLLCLKTRNVLISKDKNTLACIWNWVLKITSLLENAIMCIESMWACMSLRDRATWHACFQVLHAFSVWIPLTSQKLFSIAGVTSFGHLQFVKLETSPRFQFFKLVLKGWELHYCLIQDSQLNKNFLYCSFFNLITINSSEIIEFFSWAQAIYVLHIETLRID